MRHCKSVLIFLVVLAIGSVPQFGWAGEISTDVEVAILESSRDLGIEDEVAKALVRNYQQGKLPDSLLGGEPEEVVREEAHGYITERQIFADGSVAVTSAPILRLPDASRSTVHPYAITGCEYTGSSFGATWRNCQVTGNNMFISMAYRIDAYLERGKPAKITRYWDQQSQSATGTISHVTFSMVGSQNVVYKVQWSLAYVGAPSKTYTLSASISNAGELSSRLY